MKIRNILLKSALVVLAVAIPVGVFHFELLSYIPVDRFEAPKKVESILAKKENDALIKDTISKIEEATKNVRNSDDIDTIFEYNPIAKFENITDSYKRATYREKYDLKGVELDSRIIISSIEYTPIEEGIQGYGNTNICTPTYQFDHGSAFADYESITKGGWFLDATIPVKEDGNTIGEIVVTLDITDIPNLPKNVNSSNKELMVAKPVIYLYPKEKQDVNVRLKYAGNLHTTYPKYNDKIKGWSVIANPDGTLINKEDNLEYSYIFWDGYSDDLNPSFEEGWVVKGEDTQAFLQDILPKMGMTPKEYNEFIVYWLPLMEKNEYNLISFLKEEYTDLAELDITPKPDSILRVFMAYKELDSVEANKIKNTIKAPTIDKFERNGFTVVEWGGTKV